MYQYSGVPNVRQIARMNKLFIELFADSIDGALDESDRLCRPKDFQHLHFLAVHLIDRGNDAVYALGGTSKNRHRCRSSLSRTQERPEFCDDERLVATGSELLNIHKAARKLLRTKTQEDLEKPNCFIGCKVEFHSLNDLLHYLLVISPALQLGRLRDNVQTSIPLRNATKSRFRDKERGGFFFEELFQRTSREKEIEDAVDDAF